MNYEEWENILRGSRRRMGLEAVVNPPRLDEASKTELQAERVAKDYTKQIVFEAEQRKGCCHHHFVEAKELKEIWG